MKDITNSHKNFPKDNKIINIASFSNLNEIKNSLDNYFEHAENNQQVFESQETKAKTTETVLIKESSIKESKKLEETTPVQKKEETIAPPQPQKEKLPSNNISTSAKLYETLTQLVEDIKLKIEANELFDVNEILPLLPKLIKLNTENNELLTKALNPGRSTEWFASHSVNVTIIALKISAGLNYNNKQMYALALSTLLHDVGMLKINPNILNNHGQLSSIQMNKVKNHPKYGASIVQHLKPRYPFIEKTILQEHEKWDGSGYPNQLKEEQINPFARIIALADKFESLVHERNYRPAFKPPLAIKKIMNENHEAYDPRVLKAFINEISMYPVGSYIQLNTGQVAQVISINKNRPVRPMVKLLTSNDGKKIDKPIELNLEKEPLTYITKTVSFLD